MSGILVHLPHLHVSRILDHLLNLNPVWMLSLAALVVFAEDAIFVGFLIPGETAAVLAGVGAHEQGVPLVVAAAVVVAAAILGDTVGYEVGKRFGPRLLTIKALAKHQVRIGRAQDFLKERGGIAVFLGRFTAFFRAMMPALAGASRMPYRTFLTWNAAGGLVWGTAFVTLGFALGKSAEALAKKVGWAGTGTIVVLLVIGLVVWKIRSEREPAEESADDKSPDV